MGSRKEAREQFLNSLALTGNVSLAAAAAGLSRSSLYHWRERDRGFAEAWLEAIEAATDVLEAEARRRALEGVEQALVHGGKMVRDDEGHPVTVRRYSDNLLALLLKAHRPEKFREKFAPNFGERGARADAGGVSFTIRIGERPRDEESQTAAPDDKPEG